MPKPVAFTTLIAANIQDAGGNLLTYGTLEVVPTDVNDVPIPATAGGAGGFITTDPAVFAITNGTLPATAWVPDTNQTEPLYISYRLTVKNATGKAIYTLKGVRPFANTFNLDTYEPNVAAQAVIQRGPQGPSGAPGAIGAAGPAGPSGTTTQKAATGGFYVPGGLVLGDIATVARNTMNACLAANHNVVAGLDVWFAGPPYPGIYPSDFGLTVDAYPAAFTAAQLTATVDKFIASVDASGRFPGAIGIAGTTFTPVFFSTWDSAHNFVGGDAFFFLPVLEYIAWQKSGSVAHFLTNYPAYETALSNLPVSAATGLVHVDPAHPWLPWGFQEIVGLTGDVTLASALLYRVATQMAALYTAGGLTSRASAWTARATQIKAGLGTSSPLWDPTAGMFRAATVGCASNIDIYGSALAVYTGACSSAQATAISTYLSTNASTIFSNGVCLQTVNTAGGTDWASYGQLNADGSRTIRSYGHGQYQNGLWSVANLWICNALALTNAPLALQYATDQMSSAHPMQEWFDLGWLPDGGTTNLESPMGAGSYILSVGAAYALPYLGLGTNAVYSIDGRDYQDAATQIKLLATGYPGARVVLESASAQELHLTTTSLGDVSLTFDTTGIFAIGYTPWQGGTRTNFFSWGPGGVGLSGLTTPTISAADCNTTRSAIGLLGYTSTQSPGGELQLNAGPAGGAQSPKLKFIYGNNLSLCLDSYPGFRELPGQVLRLIANADEAVGAAAVAAFDTSGNASFSGYVVADHLVIRGKTSTGALDGHTYKVDVVGGTLTTTLVS